MDLSNINFIDAGVVILLLISAVLAFSRGFVREVLSILGWIIAGVVAFALAPQVEPILREVPYLSDILKDSCELSILAAFVVVFAATLIVVSIFTPLFAGLVANSALGPLDQGLGFLFGVARGVLLVVIALILYDIWVGEGAGLAMVEESRTRELLTGVKTEIEGQIPEDAPGWLEQQYLTLTGSCR